MVPANSFWGRQVLRGVTIGVLGLALGVWPRVARAQQCVGDCDNSGMVTVDELVKIANIQQGHGSISDCTAADRDHSNTITVDEVVASISSAVDGCTDGPDTPTPTPTATGLAPPTATPTTATPGISPTPPTSIDGIASTISNVVITSGGQITVTFTLTDGHGMPLTPVLSSTTNPAQVRVRFVIAHVEDYNGGGELGSTFSRYVNDINATNPAFDSGGTLQTIDPNAGVYTYTFKTMLPPGFDPTQTYTVGMQTDRTIAGHRIGVDPIFDLVPAGGTPQIRQDVITEQCNSCHDPLIAHGNRREVRLCTLCHTAAAVDPNGTTIEFKNMIHKLHAGKDLPSIVNGPPGSQYKISNTVFAQKDQNGVITGIGFPRSLESCTICHSGGLTTNYYTDRPAASACATCHDNVNPSLETTAAGPPGTNHFQQKGFADGDCSFCHVPDSGKEFDISVVGAHTIPERSKQLAGLNAAITGVTGMAGQVPTISFKITDGAGNPLTDLSGLDRVGFAIAGPTTDFESVTTPTAFGGGKSGTLTGPDANGVFQYMPTAAIPANATGTWSVGAEVRRVVNLTTVDPIPAKTVEEAAVNPVAIFSVDGSTPVDRRTVVVVDNCASCHGQFSKDFSIHGNLRNQTKYCVLCHNPNNSDVARRKLDPTAVAAASPVTSIDFKVMIHKIHRGQDLGVQPYDIYGFGLPPPAGTGYSINDFGDVRFPGDLRDCATCHAAGTYLLPPYPGPAIGTQVAHLDPATANLVIDGQLGPVRSVCTACHDGPDAVAHAETQTASDGTEACTVCHDEGNAFPVSVLHAGRN